MFISARLCRTHIIYRYSYIGISLCLTITQNLSSKLERALCTALLPCIALGPALVPHSTSHNPALFVQHKINELFSTISWLILIVVSMPTDVRPSYALYIIIITTLYDHIIRHHHNRNIDLTYIYTQVGLSRPPRPWEQGLRTPVPPSGPPILMALLTFGKICQGVWLTV